MRRATRALLFLAAAFPAAAQTPAGAARGEADSLPQLPRTGLDFSAVDQFWHVADLLAKDAEPSEADWRALATSVGYRLSLRVVPTTRADLEIALRPSKRVIFDSVSTLKTDEGARVSHLAATVARRARALPRLRGPVASRSTGDRAGQQVPAAARDRRQGPAARCVRALSR